MKNWYKTMTKGQKILVYVISSASVLIYLIGLIPLAILIYLELGQKDRTE